MFAMCIPMVCIAMYLSCVVINLVLLRHVTQNTSTECVWVVRIHIMCLALIQDLYGTPGAPKRAHFGPDRPFLGPRRALGSPGGPDLGPTATGWSNWVGHMAGMLHELTWTYWASISAARAPNGLFGPNSFSFVAPFRVKFYFGPNIGM